MRKKTDKYPYWDYGSYREFKSEKRQGIKTVLRELRSDEAAFGIAYSPAYEKIEQARKLLEEAEQMQSVKNWR